VAISHADAAEQPLLKLLAACAAEWHSDGAYVIPVFGRCRALEVFPFQDVDELLVRDVGEFFCGACSCRVKQANPGFDLLTAIDWNERLFGGTVPDQVAAEATGDRAAGSAASADFPQYLAIPSGNGPTEAEPAPNADRPPEPAQTRDGTRQALSAAPLETNDSSAFPGRRGAPLALVVLIALGLIGGGVIAFCARR
jgi:hypothetical protein